MLVWRVTFVKWFSEMMIASAIATTIHCAYCLLDNSIAINHLHTRVISRLSCADRCWAAMPICLAGEIEEICASGFGDGRRDISRWCSRPSARPCCRFITHDIADENCSKRAICSMARRPWPRVERSLLLSMAAAVLCLALPLRYLKG